uniref:Biogenesis of lysosome-related organelles complex 1 subunit KXD1 n=1 Tax=Peronospora matthiolae TaxID=2874970 RepID=A0AAV1UQL8_9STRA
MDGAPTTPMDPASPAPPTLYADSPIPSSTPPPSPPVRRPVVLPSSRVSAASLLSFDTLPAGIAALYGQLDLHATVVADFHSLEELCQDLKLQIGRLQTQLQSYVEIALRLKSLSNNVILASGRIAQR